MEKFMEYIAASPNCFFAVKGLKQLLNEANFKALPLQGEWELNAGGKYYVTLWDSACIAFTLPEKISEIQSPFYRIIGAHTDQPCLRIKPCKSMHDNGYEKLNVEIYGGPIFSTWLDRPLSLAGRVTLRSENPFQPKTCLVNLEKPVLIIPNLAIHMNREANSGVALNPQQDMLPVGALLSGLDDGAAEQLLTALSEELKVDPQDIIDYDLFTYVTEKPELVGFRNEFLSSPRLDDLVMVHTAATALAEAGTGNGINVLFAMDHEEAGSRTPQGAGSPMAVHILEKISLALGRSRRQFLDDIAGSFMISADVAHAVHPNHPEKHDPVMKTDLGGGPGIKMAAGQSYVTQSCDTAVYEMICEKAGVPVQKFTNRSDSRGGSTLGPIIAGHLPCHIMDMGIAILAMHSSRELMATADYDMTKKSFITFYES